MRSLLALEIRYQTCAQELTVETAEIVLVVTVLVKLVMRMLEIFVKTCVMGSIVESAVTV